MSPLEAAGWGALAASTLVFGALIAIARPVAERRLGLIMAFGSGVLVSSVAYQLTEDAVAVGGQVPMALGLGIGALVFYLGDRAIDRQGGAGMGSTRGPDQPESGPAIVAGFLLSFTFSFDDFVITTFVSGPGSSTLPLFIFGQVKRGVTPETNAVATMMLAFTLAMLLIGQLFLGWQARRSGRRAGISMAERVTEN